MRRHGWRLDRAGTAAVEFALIAPVVAIVLIGLTDWGLAIEQRERLQTAARAGAQIALFNPTDDAAIRAAVCTAAGATQTRAEALLTTTCPNTGSLGGLVPTSRVFCACIVSNTQVGDSCDAACAGTIVTSVTVSASRGYSRITPTGPTSVSANVRVRIN